jgi:hypothetical protein
MIIIRLRSNEGKWKSYVDEIGDQRMHRQTFVSVMMTCQRMMLQGKGTYTPTMVAHFCIQGRPFHGSCDPIHKFTMFTTICK